MKYHIANSGANAGILVPCKAKKQCRLSSEEDHMHFDEPSQARSYNEIITKLEFAGEKLTEKEQATLEELQKLSNKNAGEVSKLDTLEDQARKILLESFDVHSKANEVLKTENVIAVDHEVWKSIGEEILKRSGKLDEERIKLEKELDSISPEKKKALEDASVYSSSEDFVSSHNALAARQNQKKVESEKNGESDNALLWSLREEKSRAAANDQGRIQAMEEARKDVAAYKEKLDRVQDIKREAYQYRMASNAVDQAMELTDTTRKMKNGKPMPLGWSEHSAVYALDGTLLGLDNSSQMSAPKFVHNGKTITARPSQVSDKKEAIRRNAKKGFVVGTMYGPSRVDPLVERRMNYRGRISAAVQSKKVKEQNIPVESAGDITKILKSAE